MERTGHLPVVRRLTYGVGHVLNDMCASMWFSYLLLYFESVNMFSNTLAGFVLLLGQIADALATPLVGYESDHIQGFCGYGKRKSWHLLGTGCVILSFPFIFIQCITCRHADSWAQYIYYAPFVVIFQFGWASTQISHLSLIPSLSSEKPMRVELNAIRYGFTVLSNIFVYCLTWMLLGHSSSDPKEIDPDDAKNFQTLACIVVGVGSLFSVIFHIGTKEKSGRSCNDGSRNPGVNSISEELNWNDWLRKYQFYLMAGLYMCTRLIVNLTQIYLPMYIVHSIELPKKFVALIPLVVFLSGFAMSLTMRPLNWLVGRKGTYLIGLIFVGAACGWMWFIPTGSSYQALGAAVLLGFGTTTVLVTSLALTADLIGDNAASGAFVYGSMSFTDKISNGAAVMLIQYLHPCNSTTSSCCAACVWYYRDAIVLIPGGTAAVALVILLFIPMNLGHFTPTAIAESGTEDERRGLISSSHSSTRSLSACDNVQSGTRSLTPCSNVQSSAQSLVTCANAPLVT